MTTSLPEPKGVSGGVITPESDLVKRINEAHQQVQLAFVASGVAAIKVGLLLLEAKCVVKWGSWSEWIGAHCHFSERTAQVYMQLAKRFPIPQIFLSHSSMPTLVQLVHSSAREHSRVFIQLQDNLCNIALIFAEQFRRNFI